MAIASLEDMTLVLKVLGLEFRVAGLGFRA